MRDQPMLHLCLSYQSWWRFFFFFKSLIIGLLFRFQVVLNGCSVLQLSFSCGCGKKEVSTAFNYLTILREIPGLWFFIHKYGKFKVNYLVSGCICQSVTETKPNLWDWLNLHIPFILSPLSVIPPKRNICFQNTTGNIFQTSVQCVSSA